MPHPTPRTEPRRAVRALARAVASSRRFAPAGFVLALIAAVSYGATASSEPVDGIRVPSVEEFNALDRRVTELEATVSELATPSPTPTLPTTDPTTVPTGCVRPDAGNTGPSGTLSAYSGPARVTTAGAVIEDVEIEDSLVIAADDVTVRNVRVAGAIGSTADNTRIVDSAVPHVWASSASGMVVQRTDLGGGFQGDSVHVTSDAGSFIEGFTLRNSWIHDVNVPSGSHFDGIQVRGASNVLVECNNFDLGAFQDTYNAAVYFEDANGGYSGAQIVDNWLLGGAFNIMLGAANDDGAVLVGNRVGGDFRWDICKADSDASKPSVQAGNTLDGLPVTPCL